MAKKLSSVYLAEELKRQLIAEAKAKGLSLNAYITMILMERGK